jgi:putative transposase
MKKSKFTTEQIIFALRQVDAGLSIEDVCRKLGISQATFFRWKQKYGELGTPELRRLRQLEEENQKLGDRRANGSHLGGDDRRVIGTHPSDFRILRVSRQDSTEHGGQGCSRWTITHGSEGPTATA